MVCLCCRQKRLNPFEGLRKQQYKAAAKEADAAARPARPAAAHATESPASTDAGREPAQQAAGPVPPSTAEPAGMQPAAARPKEDNLRQAAATLVSRYLSSCVPRIKTLNMSCWTCTAAFVGHFDFTDLAVLLASS